MAKNSENKSEKKIENIQEKDAEVRKDGSAKSEKKGHRITFSKEAIVKWLDEFRWNRRSIIAVIVVIAVIAAVVTAAVLLVHKNNSNIITENGVEYKTADEAYLPMSNVKTLNPVISTDRDTYYISRLIYDGLFELDGSMIPQNDLAADYKFNKKNNSITIDLVNAKFQDGRKLKASDVKFTVAALKAADSSEYKDQISDISYVETHGDKRLTIYFHDYDRMTLADLTFPILPAHRYDGVYDIIYSKDIKPVGTGRYKYKKYSSSTSLVLEPYENYHGQQKAKNTITFEVMSKSADQYRMTEAGNISLMISNDAAREAKISQKDTKIKNFPSNEVEYLGFNFTDEKMAQKNIRKAIAFAVDNKSIIQECYYNSGMVNDTVYYPGYMGVKSSSDPYSYSTDEAAKYLKKAGYEDRDDDGYVENKDMGELSITLLSTSTGSRYQSAEMIKSELEDAGIHVSLSVASEKSYLAALKSGNFDVFIGGFKYSENMDMSQILKGTPYTVKYEYETGSSSNSSSSGSSSSSSSSGAYEDSTTGSSSGSTEQKTVKKKSYSTQITNSNYTRYYSKNVNSLLSDMDSGLTNVEMKIKFKKMKAALIEDLPYYCLLYKTSGAVKADTLYGTVEPVFWNVYRGCNTWKSKYEVDSSGSSSSNSGN